jgi:DNA-binding beta-propeller fold protein YncE
MMNFAPQKLHHGLVFGSHGAKVIVLRHLLGQGAQIFVRGHRQSEKARFGALKYESILGVARRGRWRVAAARWIRPLRTLAVNDVKPRPVTADAHGIRIPPGRDQPGHPPRILSQFDASGEVSGDGWNWSTAARATDSIEKTVPVEYAGHGLDYTYEGGERNINSGIASRAERLRANPLTPSDDDLLPGTANVSAPDAADDDENSAGAGYLWDGALRGKLTLRNYGFFIDLLRYRLPENIPAHLPPIRDPRAEGAAVAFATNTDLAPLTDPYYRGFDERLPDYWRFKEWEHEFDDYVRNGNLPALELVRLGGDHFGDFAKALDGVNTVEAQMADNDYALGLVIDKIVHSPYRNDTLVFVVEDDAQDGPDHVDAHRSLAFIVGPYVRQRALVSERYTSVHVLRTIEDVLGIEPLGLNDSSVEPMTAVFDRAMQAWDYRATVPVVLKTTQLPLAATAAAGPAPVGGLDDGWPRRNAAYWAAKTQGMDFSAEDRVDTPLFNRILWEGLMGDAVPFPEMPRAQNLRRHRDRLLRRFARRKIAGEADPG